jgi:hypothetical protein
LLLILFLGFLSGAFGLEVGEETHGWIMAWLFVEVIGGQTSMNIVPTEYPQGHHEKNHGADEIRGICACDCFDYWSFVIDGPRFMGDVDGGY